MTHSKRCPDCQQTKPADEWGKNKRVKDGLAAYCKVCTAVRNRAQYVANRERRLREAAEYRAANALAISERARERRATDQHRAVRQSYKERNAERISAVAREWRERNPGYSRAWRAGNPNRIDWERAHRDANRERFRGYAAAQRAASPERFRIAKHKYRAARIANGHIKYTREQWLEKFDYWGKRCWICTADLSHGEYNIDHVKPINKGGMDCLANLRPACESRNKSKSDRWPFNPSEVINWKSKQRQ